MEVYFVVVGSCWLVIVVGVPVRGDEVFNWAYVGSVVACIVFQSECKGAFVPGIPAQAIVVVWTLPECCM